VCMSVAGVMGAVQRAQHNFIWTETAPLLATIAAWIVLLATLPRYGVYAAAWVQVLRMGLHAALLSNGLGRFAGFVRDGHTLNTAWQRMRPLIAGTAYSRTEPLVDRSLSSLGSPGELSIYYLCLQLCTAATQFLYNALIAPLVPVLAWRAKAGEWPAFDQARRRSGRTLLLLGLTGFVLLLVGGSVLLALGAVPPSADEMVRRARWQVLGLAGVLIAAPLGESLRTVYYATGNTSTPARLDAVVFTCGLVLKVVGFSLFGVWGMALAASTQSLLAVLVLRRGLSRVIPLDRPASTSGA
jgi:putative peptidoglycan lipid II flippase